MRINRYAAAALCLLVAAAGAFAQAKPLVAVLSCGSPLYASAAIVETKGGAKLSAGEPLLVLQAQDKRLTLDGMPTLWYQVKAADGRSGWIPGSRLSFSAAAFDRAAFKSPEQYASYIKLAARPGEMVVAARSFEKVAKGDIGYLVVTHDGDLPAAVVWERNLAATPDESYLPKGFPKALQPFVYFVDFPVFELAGDQAAASFDSLAKRLPSAFPEEDGFYADMPDDDFPWYTPPEATYSYDDYGYEDYGDGEYYGDDEPYYDEDYVEGEETYGMIKVGSVVILGEHDDVNGGKDWADGMAALVGKQVTVKELPGADSQGFLVVRVKENSFVWRVRNLTLKGRGEAGSYGYKIGDKVILGAHRYIDDDNNWASEMQEYVGMEATITSLEGTDGSGSYIVHVDVDDGDWYWRVETMTPVK